MQRAELRRERLIFIFLVAVAALNPPFLTIFDIPSTLLGVPVLYIYLFVCWAAVIAAAAATMEAAGPDEHAEAGPEEEFPPARDT